MPERKFEIVEHTADVGIRAYGDSMDECFENAAMGMFNIIADLSKVDCVGEVIIKLEADDMEMLLVDFLTELLYLYEVEEILPCEISVRLDEEEKKLEARVKGEKIDQQKHVIKTEIKAVTYHMLEINRERGSVQLLFDI